MTTAAIMQPTYLPYLGYFHLIAASDVFVFLDNVQFARRSWQSRNRIMTRDGERMLTVPTRKTDRDALICDIEIATDTPWWDRHLSTVRHAYAGRPGFRDGVAFLAEHLAVVPGQKLADLNIAIIEATARRLGLRTRFARASALVRPGHRSDHLLAICRAVGATDYLSPMGSHDYMEDDGVFAAAAFPVRFQGFVEVPYPMGGGEFVPYMAFIDALMNVGWDGLREILDRMLAAAAPSATAARP
ncbi:MAG: WbqC family protein [Phenylobacterium sp.]